MITEKSIINQMNIQNIQDEPAENEIFLLEKSL